MSILGRTTSCQVLPEYSIPLKPDNYLMITREPPDVCVPNGLETPVKLFSYPSYGAPIHWEIC